MALEIKALIFDFGGVISRTLFETHSASERELGLPSGTLDWLGPFAPESDLLWKKMQLGKISEREYWRLRTEQVAQLIGKNWTNMSDLVKAVRSKYPLEIIRPQFLNFFKSLESTNLRLAILSNELDLFYGPDFRKHLPFFKKFDVIYDATYTKILKPDPNSYLACIKSLGLVPQDCLFIDDQIVNIKGAELVGLNTVQFDVTKPSKSYERIKSYIGMKNE